DRGRQIPTHALRVIDVVLQQEIGMPGSFDDSKPRRRGWQKVAGSGERVEWFDDLQDTDACGGVCGVAQVPDEGRRLRLLGYIGQSQPRQAVESSATERRRDSQPLMDSAAE